MIFLYTQNIYYILRKVNSSIKEAIKRKTGGERGHLVEIVKITEKPPSVGILM